MTSSPKRATWDTADAEAVRILLQRLALQALSRTLGVDRDVPTISNADLAQLWPIFPEEVRANPRLRWAQARSGSAFLMTEPPAYSRAQSHWILAAGGTPIWTRIRDTWVSWRNGSSRSTPTAPYVRASLALDAWSSTEFQLVTTQLIRQHLRTRVLLFPRPPEDPILTDVCLWLLISVELNRVATTNRKLPLLEQRVTLYVDNLLQVRSGWAGFWDQYIIGLVLRQNPQKFRALATLPLLAGTDAQQGPAKRAPRPKWKEAAPPFVDQLIAGLP